MPISSVMIGPAPRHARRRARRSVHHLGALLDRHLAPGLVRGVRGLKGLRNVGVGGRGELLDGLAGGGARRRRPCVPKGSRATAPTETDEERGHPRVQGAELESTRDELVAHTPHHRGAEPLAASLREGADRLDVAHVQPSSGGAQLQRHDARVGERDAGFLADHVDAVADVVPVRGGQPVELRGTEHEQGRHLVRAERAPVDDADIHQSRLRRTDAAELPVAAERGGDDLLGLASAARRRRRGSAWRPRRSCCAATPRPSTSTSTTSPGCTGREFAGVPDRITSPGNSVIVRAMSATR